MSSVFAPWVSANAPAVAARSATQNAVESTRATPGRFYAAFAVTQRFKVAGADGRTGNPARPDDGAVKRRLRSVGSRDPSNEQLPDRPDEKDDHEDPEAHGDHDIGLRRADDLDPREDEHGSEGD